MYANGRPAARDWPLVLVVGTQVDAAKVLGFRFTRAKKTLEDAGFKVGTKKYGSSDNYDDEVDHQAGPGRKLPRRPRHRREPRHQRVAAPAAQKRLKNAQIASPEKGAGMWLPVNEHHVTGWPALQPW